MNAFENARQWLLSSGLVINDSNSTNFGGVYSSYDEKKRQYGFVYPEITGYFISTLRFLNSIESKQEYKNLAKISSNWLISIYEKYGGIIQGLDTENKKQNLVYSFDTGICAKGLLDCYVMSSEKKYFDYANKLVDWLITEALNEDGSFKSLKNLKTKKFEERYDVWYNRSGCLHIKLTIPILQMYTINNNSKLLEKANIICNTFKQFQNEDGSFSLHKDGEIIHLHTMCYSLEGLLYAYKITNNAEFLESCVKAIDWCCTKIQNDGGINLWFNSTYSQSKSSYHIAQLIRLMIVINNIKGNDEYRKNIDNLYSFLLTLQAHGTSTINGGFYEEFYKSIFGWKKRLRLNSWGSMFALQAIYYKNNPTQSTDEQITSLF